MAGTSEMTFTVYIPPAAQTVPVLYWLSGGAFRTPSKDTSPPRRSNFSIVLLNVLNFYHWRR